MERAILARPLWRDPVQGAAPLPQDPRIISAPLQVLALLSPDSAVLESHLRAPNPWLVLTSPASVVAFGALAKRLNIDLSQHALRYAAVGNGTRDQLLRSLAHVPQAEVVVSAETEKSDAHSTLAALDRVAAQQGWSWAEQQFLVIEGADNRPTLREGLKARGAQAGSYPIYERINVDWPEPLWQQLAQAKPGEIGIVITSTTVIARVLELIRARGLDPLQFSWCTQHLAIATQLVHAGLGPIHRVRLDAQHITDDLFIYGNHW